MSQKLIRVAAGLALASALGICASATAICAARADIISTVGLAQVAPPSTVGADFIINGGLQHQLIFKEQQGVVLASPLVTDTGTIAAGTIVNSYFFAVNAAVEAIVNTSVTFSGNVLGIIFQEDINGLLSPNFASSDFLGAIGTSYQESACLHCGFETVGQAQDQGLIDTAGFTGNVASFHNYYSIPGDFARIIVDDPVAVPGPIAGAGLPGLLFAGGGLLGWWRRRQKIA
jgi:hypothetical protein